MKTNAFKACTVLFLVGLSLISLCVDKKDGGGCSSKDFAGKCTITNVKGTNSGSPNDLGSAEVHYSFISAADEINPYNGITASSYLGLYCLKGPHSPTLAQTMRCSVTVGAVFDCTLSVATSGSCTPITVRFTDNGTCANEGEYQSGAIAMPLFNRKCCEGLQAYDTITDVSGAEQLCYDPTKGVPFCGIVPSLGYGWYYKLSEGQLELLRSEKCQVANAVCGDGKCETGETVTNCPQDCNNTSDCSSSKDADSCSKAGGIWGIVPGKGYLCNCPMTREQIETCKGVCKAAGTTYVNCDYGRMPTGSFLIVGKTTCCCKSFNTSSTCGDGSCSKEENATNCPQDCNQSAGCLPEGGSNFSVRGSLDCCAGLQKNWLPTGPTTPRYTCSNCGNGKCDNGETNANCAKDCFCGDGRCDPAESDGTCPQDCTNACLKEGKSGGPGSPKCCGNLTMLSLLIIPYNNVCDAMSGSGFICTKCGDGICGKGENFCNCAKDCTKPECYKDGETFRGSPGESANPSQYCCAGLKALRQIAQSNNACGNYYTNSLMCTSATCGDGVCSKGEDECNCPNDCVSTDNCAKEGELRYLDQAGKGSKSHACCPGLTAISNCDENGNFTSSANICTKCGDSICGEGENKINCPIDCSNIRGGSNCSYKTFNGKCLITNVNTGTIGYIITGVNAGTISYSFSPFENVNIGGTFVASKETLSPYTGVAPAAFLGLSCDTPEQINQCSLKIGVTYSCNLLVATQGTCAPITVQFFKN